jgi:hypothetical protein
MITKRAAHGPFLERPHFSDVEFERIALEALKDVELYPSSPGPIRIDRFIEKKFRVVPEYEDLPTGVLGYTRFGAEGVEAVVVAKALDSENTEVARRRIKTTLAHEGSHGLLHAPLFAMADVGRTVALFENDGDISATKMLCRTGTAQGGGTAKNRGYDKRWWEYQANQLMGALLIPQPLMVESLKDLLTGSGSMGLQVLEEGKREHAAQLLSEVFDLNPIVASIRLEKIYPKGSDLQLTL